MNVLETTLGSYGRRNGAISQHASSPALLNFAAEAGGRLSYPPARHLTASHSLTCKSFSILAPGLEKQLQPWKSSFSTDAVEVCWVPDSLVSSLGELHLKHCLVYSSLIPRYSYLFQTS